MPLPDATPWSGLAPAACTVHLFYPARGDEVAGLPSVLGSAGDSVAAVCGVHLGSFGEGDHVLPRVLVHRPTVAVRSGPDHLPPAVVDADLTLIALPFGGLVACLRLAVPDPARFLRPLLAVARDGAQDRGLLVNGLDPLLAAVQAADDEWLGPREDADLRAQLQGLQAAGTAGFHLLAFEEDALDLVDDAEDRRGGGHYANVDAVADLIYYGALPYGYDALRDETGVRLPVLSNRYRGTLAAVGPNGAVTVAHARQLTNAMVVTCSMALAAMEQARFIWHAVYAERELLSEAGRDGRQREPADGRKASVELVGLNARLRTWETELSYGALAYVDVRPLVRSSVVGEFHFAMAESIALPAAVGTAQALLDRLNQAADGRRRELALRRQTVDDRRNTRLSVMAALFAVLAIVPTIVFGFYGSNVGLVDGGPGFFDAGFMPFLLVVGTGTAIAIGALVVAIVAGSRERSRAEAPTPKP